MKLVTDPGMIQNQTLLIILPGLGWTLTRHYPQFFICRNCIRMFTKLCLACPCPCPPSTLLSAISSPGSWLVLSPSSVSHLCPGPLLPPDLHLRHWLGASYYVPLFFTSKYYLASEAILQKWAVTLIGTSCIFLNPDGYVLWSVLYLLHGHNYGSITLIS